MTEELLFFGFAGGLAPVAAHLSGLRCWIFLPAHFPALLAGLCGGPWVGACAALGMVVGQFTVRGPRGKILAAICAEVLAYGVLAGIFSEGATGWPRRLVALAGAMIGGRVVYLLTAGSLRMRIDGEVFKDLFLAPWPGIALQLAVLPILANGGFH